MNSLPGRLARKLRHWSRYAADRDYRHAEQENRRLATWPRRAPTQTTLFGKTVALPDALSFCCMRDDIFLRERYRFQADTERPYILDCGSNIGLTILYFKRLYPQARVVGFEPDRETFEYLRKNLAAFGVTDVELQPKAVWDRVTTLSFMPDQADGGRIVAIDPARTAYEVDTVRLRDFLDRPVDLLKIDIEGAETEVLRDCADRLGQVKRIVLEYHSLAGQPQTLPEMVALLAGAGFRLHVHPVVISPQPFVARELNSGMDLQLNLYGFRE